MHHKFTVICGRKWRYGYRQYKKTKSTFDTVGTAGTKNKAMNHIQPTDVDYIDSIEDLFFKSVAQQVIITDAQQGGAADETNRRLEDLEIGVRKKLFELLQENEKLQCNDHDENDIKESDNNEIADVIGTFWKSTLDLCHHIVHHASSSSCTRYDNMASCRRLPFLLLSDCLEGLPSLEDTQKFWINYVEPVLVDTLFGDKFWCQLTETNNSKKISLPSSHLPFLKVTNQFLKRLEYSSDNAVRVEWKGRILWALSKGFSIADKSAMKSWGNFHTTNATDFESKEEFDKVLRTNIASSTNTSTTSVVEYNIYEAFWYLQNDFANPSKIQVGEFIKKLRLILAAMESATASGSGCKVSKIVTSRTIHSKQVKYLTSSALLPSQMNDPSFRSSVLTQFLIVASHLGAESPPLKNALASLLVRARKLLQNDHPHLHKILWESILATGREDDWRQWKKQKCLSKVFAPNFKRKIHLDLGDAVDVITKSSSKKRRSLDYPLGDTTTLDNENATSEGMFTSSSHNFLDRTIPKDFNEKIPTLEQHLELYVDALDPDSGIEDEYHPKNNSLFTWRAMRLYAKHQLPLMSQCRKPADLEKITREWYRNSHGKDIPGEMPSSELSDDDDDYKKIATTVDEDDDGENVIDSSDADVEMKDDKAQKGIGDMPSTKKDTDDNDEAENNIDMDESTDVKIEILSEKNGLQLDVTKMNKQDTNDHERKGENELEKTKKENPSESTVKEEDSDQRKQTTNISETSSKPKDTGKSNGDQGSNKGRKNNKGQEKPPPREDKSERRGNDGGRNSQERGRRDDGPPPRRNRNEETQQSRGGGRSGADASYRGRQPDGPTPRGGGGRYDDDYNGDSNRQNGRGERYSGDGSSGTGGRENFRGNSGGGGGERGGGGGRDDHRSADRSGDRNNRSRGSGSGGGGGGGSRRRR